MSCQSHCGQCGRAVIFPCGDQCEIRKRIVGCVCAGLGVCQPCQERERVKARACECGLTDPDMPCLDCRFRSTLSGGDA